MSRNINRHSVHNKVAVIIRMCFRFEISSERRSIGMDWRIECHLSKLVNVDIDNKCCPVMNTRLNIW